MTYKEAIDYLYGLRLFGAKFGLSNTLKLAEMAGNPQEKLRFIHVAGTNGKGSTCAMLESIYRTAGLKVGLFTSPHLVTFGERIQVNRQNIPQADVVRQMEELKPLLAQFPAEHHPTFFEVVTVMALRYFAEKKCELVIWETGLGGRLDATNIVTPLASVITNIQFDHEKWLGSTLTSIAAEKAGIIKQGVPVVSGAEEPEALEVIESTAQRNGAPLTVVTRKDLERPPLDEIEIPLLGEHQRFNAAVALAAVRAVSSIQVSEPAFRQGLSGVRWPGRLQLITRSSGQQVLLDGAHNVAGACALKTALKEHFAERRITLVIGTLADKNADAICGELAPLADRILVVPVDSDRRASSSAVALSSARANASASVVEMPTLKAALESSQAEFTVVTGSLYLVGEALEHLTASDIHNERSLNEWQPTMNKRS
jgi:dihydrofolate synthase / folylpolyglutamate synthase